MTFRDIRKWLAGKIYPPYRKLDCQTKEQLKTINYLLSITKTLKKNNWMLRIENKRKNDN